MARSSAERPGRKAARRTAGDAGSGEREAALENERARLAAELERADARIAELEMRQAEVAERIAWVLDTLHSVIEDAT